MHHVTLHVVSEAKYRANSAASQFTFCLNNFIEITLPLYVRYKMQCDLPNQQLEMFEDLVFLVCLYFCTQNSFNKPNKY